MRGRSAKVLYGQPLLAFLARRCPELEPLAAHPPVNSPATPECEADKLQLWDAFEVLQGEWLKQRPDALHGESVISVLQRDYEHLCSDLEDRELQWVQTGQPPIALCEDDTAYRCAGFGPHEGILYDEMVLYLMQAYCRHLATCADPSPDVAVAVEWLRQRRDEWLGNVSVEGLMGKSPQEVIDYERRRLPLRIEDSDQVLHDDCPLCQMMLHDNQQPMFLRLSGYSAAQETLFDLDVDFGYDDDELDDDEGDPSEEEQDDNFNDVVEGCESAVTRLHRPGRATDERGNIERRIDSANGDRPGDRQAAHSPPMDSVWKRVCIMSEPGEVSAEIDLFTIAACTGELIEDLKERRGERSLIDTLNRHVGNVVATLRGAEHSLLAPVVGKFCESLDDLEKQYRELSDKVADLQYRLLGLVQTYED